MMRWPGRISPRTIRRLISSTTRCRRSVLDAGVRTVLAEESCEVSDIDVRASVRPMSFFADFDESTPAPLITIGSRVQSGWQAGSDSKDSAGDVSFHGAHEGCRNLLVGDRHHSRECVVKVGRVRQHIGADCIDPDSPRKLRRGRDDE